MEECDYLMEKSNTCLNTALLNEGKIYTTCKESVVLVFLYLLRGKQIQIARKVLLSVAVVSMAAAESSLTRLNMRNQFNK